MGPSQSGVTVTFKALLNEDSDDDFHRRNVDSSALASGQVLEGDPASECHNQVNLKVGLGMGMSVTVFSAGGLVAGVLLPALARGPGCRTRIRGT
jgi:hypothetical protein